MVDEQQLDAANAAEHEKIDALELAMLSAPAADLVNPPVFHHFTPGIYTREIFMAAGQLLTSKIHKIEHPFVILRGKVSVYIPGQGVCLLEGPCAGITQAGTRRILLIHEDTIWVTFHPNPEDSRDLDVIEDHLIARRELADGKTANELFHEFLGELSAGTEPTTMPVQLDYGGAP